MKTDLEYSAAVSAFARKMADQLSALANTPKTTWHHINQGVTDVARQIGDEVRVSLVPTSAKQDRIVSPLFTVRDLLSRPRRNLSGENLLILAAATILELVAQKPSA